MSSLWRCRSALVRPSMNTIRAYNWGNYDASSGECCKMRDAVTTECAAKKQVCQRMTSLANLCYRQTPTTNNQTMDDYPKILQEIYQRSKGQNDCDLFKHDVLYYKPSDKCRRYQRTWPECPLIWLRPKQICCYDREYYPPMERRPKPPPRAALTAVEKHLAAMKLLCTEYLTMPGCKKGRQPPKCSKGRSPRPCKKKLAPYPSFSECDKSLQRFCPTECTCRTIPSMCDVWAEYHNNLGKPPNCTHAAITRCAYRKRSRRP